MIQLSINRRTIIAAKARDSIPCNCRDHSLRYFADAIGLAYIDVSALSMAMLPPRPPPKESCAPSGCPPSPIQTPLPVMLPATVEATPFDILLIRPLIGPLVAMKIFPVLSTLNPVTEPRMDCVPGIGVNTPFEVLEGQNRQ